MKRFGSATTIHYRSFVVYLSCFGKVEITEPMSKGNALSIAAYLRTHPIAKPLYIINATVYDHHRQ